MSSEGSIESPTSRIRQFGLYRTIDARTEEFLRLSRKRQFRQGCVCAAVSTAITVTLVIVILLIYEYTIAVKWSLVQIKRKQNGTNVTNITHDIPFAERLDRSHFGFDQDYFERMPLLVNALQERNYIDPLLETSRPISKMRYNKTITTVQPPMSRNNFSQIKRTSPRPFIFEYRSPTPHPFSKTYGSRSWVERYRNAQRLQNIRHVIKYLEKTINTKVNDNVYTKPESSHTSIAFSGVYVEPMVDKQQSGETNKYASDMQFESSNKVQSLYANHRSDPLFNFKPNNPGDVNLLADGLWRFSPALTSSISTEDKMFIPMFKKIPDYEKSCIGSSCKKYSTDVLGNNYSDLIQSSTETSTVTSSNKQKSFSVMLNLYPLKEIQNSVHNNSPDVKTHPPIEKIYFTTSKPVRFQFKRKSTNAPVRRNYYRYKKPKYLIQKSNEREMAYKPSFGDITTENSKLETTKMIVHVNVYSPEVKTDMARNSDIDVSSTTTHASTFTPITEAPVQLSSGQVEDSHDGSSGVIPVQVQKTESPIYPSIPQVTTMIPFFETDTASSETIPVSTSPPEIVKFNPEDAKIPDQYLNMMETTTQIPYTEATRRFSVESSEILPEVEAETLVIKLKNGVTTTTEKIETTTDVIEEEPLEEDAVKEDATSRTYVPQINGHYRSFSSTSATVTSAPNRKRRLEMSVTGFRTYVPMYVEIKRNKTKSLEENHN